MLIYLDNCCFNRPFDDQSQLRIRLEAEAKLSIQSNILSGLYKLVWSYILEYENSFNPFREKREQIARWQFHSATFITENKNILNNAEELSCNGLKKMDALHLACAIEASADYFLTTDDGILKKSELINGIKISDPIGFIKKAAS